MKTDASYPGLIQNSPYDLLQSLSVFKRAEGQRSVISMRVLDSIVKNNRPKPSKKK